MPEPIEWVSLYNPELRAWHRVPDSPDVLDDFEARGFETAEQSAARAEHEAEQLRGRELDKALDRAGLSKSGTVAQKQARLAEHAAEAAVVVPEDVDPSGISVTPTEENEDQ